MNMKPGEERMKASYRFSLQKKLVLFTIILALITYSCSALFIYIVYDYIKAYWHVSSEVFMILTLLAGVIWSGILAFFAARVITKPLERLEEAASEAANGNLQQTIQIPSSDDEIRSLSIAFAQMFKSIQGMVNNMNGNVAQTNDIVTDLKEVATAASEHAAVISSTSEDISHGAVGAAESIQQTAEAVEEATELAQAVQAKAEQSTEMSMNMLRTLDDSETNVNQLVEGIQQVATEQEESLTDVGRLQENALEVASIITMVSSIAEQTNLLALNASIEAARAGEQGQGFAVVAEEIRKLADQSAQAAQQISSLITSIQTDIRVVVQKMDEHVVSARQEAQKGTKTNESIAAMAKSVTLVAEEVSTIQSLVNQQLTFFQATVEQSQEVAAIAEETSAATEEVSAVVLQQEETIQVVDRLAQDLEAQAEELKLQIHQFTV